MSKYFVNFKVRVVFSALRMSISIGDDVGCDDDDGGDDGDCDDDDDGDGGGDGGGVPPNDYGFF